MSWRIATEAATTEGVVSYDRLHELRNEVYMARRKWCEKYGSGAEIKQFEYDYQTTLTVDGRRIYND